MFDMTSRSLTHTHTDGEPRHVRFAAARGAAHHLAGGGCSYTAQYTW
jgi:hypothetical protein